MAVARHLIRLPERVRSNGPRLRALAERIRSRHLFLIDVVGLAAMSTLAMAMWLDAGGRTDTMSPYVWVIGIIVAVHAAVNILFGLYATSWRYASIGDMGRVISCATVGTAVAAALGRRSGG